jgi:hypothetical protein
LPARLVEFQTADAIRVALQTLQSSISMPALRADMLPRSSQTQSTNEIGAETHHRQLHTPNSALRTPHSRHASSPITSSKSRQSQG